MAKKRKTDVKQDTCTLDEEMLMWTSYRYCIGRKTYVSSLAGYIAKKYYPILSDERKLFTANDIRSSILDCIRWSPFDFSYEGTVNYSQRKPMEDLMEFMKENNIDSEEKIMEIEAVSVYHETYNDDEKHKYRISKQTPNQKKIISQFDIECLFPWMDLASLFDINRHKLITVEYDGKKKEILAFESWIGETVECEDSPGYYSKVPWRWKKVYKSVDNFIEKGEHCGYIEPSYITSIEDKKIKNVK